MANIDPRANPTVGTEFVSGQITDKALALLDILNQVTGTKGKSVREIETINDDGTSSNLMLGAYDISTDYSAQAWETTQRVYFQTTPQRLALIQDKLQENLTKIQTDITSNIGKLFDIIEKNPTDGGLDIKNLLDAGEITLINSNGNDILTAGATLEQTIIDKLTGDTALDEIIDLFMQKFTLDIQRLDSEIFNLLDDKDGKFSNGSTDAAAAKYIVINKDSKAIIADNINDVFNAVFKTPYEADHGSSSWTTEIERTTLNNFTNSNFQKGTLNLSSGIISKIIEDKDISDDDLKSITSQAQFLSKYNFEELVNLAASYYGTSGDRDATIKQLSLDHLEAITPKYFEDQRTLQDILTGKGNSSDTSNLNRVFQSAGDQIKEAASGAIELLGSGFEKLSRNNFENFVRDNPILAIEHLETKKASLTNPQEIATIDNQITKLIEFNKREVNSLIQWYTEKNKRLDKTNDADEIAHNTELLNVLGGTDSILSKLDSYNGSTSAKEIIGLYNGSSELKLQELDINNGEAFNDAALDKIIEAGLKVQNIHAALYANEMLESGKLNANYSGKELAKPGQDGTIPEDKQIAPPPVSPTISSGIIAVIGNEILYKANSLLNSTDVPDSHWVDNNVTILKDIDNQIASGALAPNTTAGKAFLDNLKKVFRETIKQFVTSGVQSFKNNVDAAKQAISDNQEAIDSQQVLFPNNSDLTLNASDINNMQSNLNNIANSIGLDPQTKKDKFFQRDNFINRAGLSQVNNYLTTVTSDFTTIITGLQASIDGADSQIGILTTRKTILENNINNIDDSVISDAETFLNSTTTIASTDRKQQLNDDLASGDPEIIKQAIQSIIQILNNNIDNLQDTKQNALEEKQADQKILDQANQLLNQPPNNIKGAFSRLTHNVNKALGNTTVSANQNILDVLNNNRPALLDNYKDKLKIYSDKLTDHFRDNTDPTNDVDGVITTDIEQKFRDALIDTSLDLNKDGINDFQNIQNAIDKISELGDNVANVFGTDSQQTGGVHNQNIKRLILMMFVMSILEYSDWEYNKSEADLSRYAVPE